MCCAVTSCPCAATLAASGLGLGIHEHRQGQLQGLEPGPVEPMPMEELNPHLNLNPRGQDKSVVLEKLLPVTARVRILR